MLKIWALTLLGLGAVLLQTTCQGSLKEKNDAFYACCNARGLFDTEAFRRRACSYSVLKQYPTGFGFQSDGDQSGWVRCFGGNKDNTACCKKAGAKQVAPVECP
jgi:hypothetical protein